MFNPSDLSSKDLKAELTRRGVDIAGCIEKADLVALLVKSIGQAQSNSRFNGYGAAQTVRLYGRSYPYDARGVGIAGPPLHAVLENLQSDMRSPLHDVQQIFQLEERRDARGRLLREEPLKKLLNANKYSIKEEDALKLTGGGGGTVEGQALVKIAGSVADVLQESSVALALTGDGRAAIATSTCTYIDEAYVDETDNPFNLFI